MENEIQVLSKALERVAITPEEKSAVGRSLQRLASIMARYSDSGDKGVIGGYNGSFPLSAATAGNIYLEPKTGKYYRCETNYNGTQITGPNSNFVDLSVAANADRLNNLIAYKTIQKLFETEDTLQINFEYPQGFNEKNSKILISNLGDSKSTAWIAKTKNNILTVQRLTSKTMDFWITLLFIKIN